MPAAMLDGAEGFEPDLRGRLPAGAPPIGVAGLDVVREPDGALLVLEDNVRTPSGFAYALAARDAVARGARASRPGPEPRRASFALLGRRAARRRAGGRAARSRASSSSPTARAAPPHWEHAEVARRLGVPLVTLDDLEHRGGRRARRCATTAGGVDVVYRRSDEDACATSDGALTPVGGAPARAVDLRARGRRQRLRDRRRRRQARPRPRGGHGPLLPRRGAARGRRCRRSTSAPTAPSRRSWATCARTSSSRGSGHGGDGVVVCGHADDGGRSRRVRGRPARRTRAATSPSAP